MSKEVTDVPRLHQLAKKRLAHFYPVLLMYQQLPSDPPKSFFSAEIVVLSTDMRALFWSLAVPDSPKNRFMMPSQHQAILDNFQATYGSLAIAAAIEQGYDAVASLDKAEQGKVVLLKKPSEILVLRFEDVQVAFRWFQMLVMALGLYYLSPGTSLLSNLSDRKSNFITGFRDHLGEANHGNLILNIAEKDSLLQNYKQYYKVFSVASLKDGDLVEKEFILPYKAEVKAMQTVQEWEDLIITEFSDMDFTSRAVLHEFFLSLEYNWTVRSSTPHFPLFSDTTSNLQRSETLTRAFICRKKLLQLAKKTKEEDLVHNCETAKVACATASSPYEDFITLSEAFFQATVMRTFLIAYSVRTM